MKKILVIFSVWWILAAVEGFGYEAGDIQIHGYISQGYLKSDHNNFIAETEEGSFQFNETAINFSAYLAPGLRAGMQFLARDFGNVGNDEVVIDWAYADYQWLEQLAFRAGKMRMPLGFYSETRDIDMTRSTILLPAGVYNESWRGLFTSLKGIGIYGDIDLNIIGSLSYQCLAGAIGLEADSGVMESMNDLINTHTDSVDTDSAYLANLQWNTPLEGLRLEASTLWTDVESRLTTKDGQFWRYLTVEAFRQKTGLTVGYENLKSSVFDLVGANIYMPIKAFPYTLSAEYTRENLRLTAEYYELCFEYSFIHQPSSIPLVKDAKFYQEGYYAGIEYRFADWLEMGLYHSEYYWNKDDKDGERKSSVYGFPKHAAWTKDTCLSARFDINMNWVFKIEGHMMDGTAILHRTDNTEGMEKDWFLFAAKVTFSF
ncbi:MAG: hypothetical protein GY749_36690 [Desulfobacteraceae bacterium]|nr:hypothetical protein [Desulfobacteraceae bacterium]